MIPRPELGRGAVDVAVLDTAPLVGGNEGWQSIRTIIVGDDDVVVVVVVPPPSYRWPILLLLIIPSS